MKSTLFFSLIFLASLLPAQEHQHQDPANVVVSVERLPDDKNLPSSEETAKARLETSPRHGEFIDVKIAGTDETIRTWIVYPERKDKAPIVIVIHEIYGLTDWLRGVADQLAKEGFIGIAPDLISGMGPNGGGTESFSSRDDVVKAIRGLSTPEATRRLNAVRSWAIKLPSANGKSATVGYCWGGTQSFEFAGAQPELNAAVVYYGTSPDASVLAKVKPPVLGLYGGDDARVNATIEPATAEMKKLKKTYETEIYEGAGHGFLRAQSGRDGANFLATKKAWPRMVEFFKKHF